MSLKGKSAVVTGGAQGIGKAIAELLLQQGAKVAILDVNESEGQRVKDTFDKVYPQEKTLFIKCDVGSEKEFKDAFQEVVEIFGQISIMCNNAGIVNEAQWEKTIAINLTGVIRGSYLALDHMNKLTGGQGGVIVNTASMAGLGPLICCPVYTATKHGVVGFTRTMAEASVASSYGVRFNALCPGYVETVLLSNLSKNMGQFSHLNEQNQESMEKLGILNVSKVAECFLELATDETKNGEALMVHSKGQMYITFPPSLV